MECSASSCQYLMLVMLKEVVDSLPTKATYCQDLQLVFPIEGEIIPFEVEPSSIKVKEVAVLLRWKFGGKRKVVLVGWGSIYFSPIERSFPL